MVDLDCHPGLFFSGLILKTIFLSLSSNCWLDVILIFCCLFNSISALPISVALCQCHSVALFFSPLSFSFLGFFPQTLSESLSLSLYPWVSVSLFSGPPFSSPWTSPPSLWVSVFLSFWVHVLIPPPPLWVSAYLCILCFLLLLSPSPFISVLPAVCLWLFAFCCSLE